MKIYNSIKNAGRKYLASAVLTTALAFGSNAYAKTNELPIYPETKISIKKTDEKIKGKAIEKQRFYESDIEKAVYSFNEGISDKYFSKQEQIKVSALLKEARDYSKSEGLTSNPQADKLYDLIRKHRNKFLFFKSKNDLEKQLGEMKIKVQAPVDNYVFDAILIAIGVSIAGGVGSLLGLIHRGKIR